MSLAGDIAIQRPTDSLSVTPGSPYEMGSFRHAPGR